MLGAGGLAARVTELARAEAFVQEALALARGVGARREEAEALFALGLLCSVRGDTLRGRALQEQGLQLYQEINDSWGIAHALGPVAQSAFEQREYERAARLYSQSLALFRQIGDGHEVAGALENLAGVIRMQGDLVRAETLAQESLGIYREMADKHGIATALKTLGCIARDRGYAAYARNLFDESITLFSDMGDLGCGQETMAELDELLRRQADYET